MKKIFLFIVAVLAIGTLPLLAEEQTFLRFYNNDALAAHDVVLNCGGVERTIAVAAHASADVDSDDCSDARFSAPDAITAVRANATQQWAVTSNDSCPSVPLLLPPFGCTLGVATAAVNEIPGATYSWSVDGASITSGNGSSRIELRLGSGDAAGVAVSIHRGDCITTSVGIIKLTAPVVLHVSTRDNSDGTHTTTCRYTSSTGTGVKTITVSRYNTCEGLLYSTFTITVH